MKPGSYNTFPKLFLLSAAIILLIAFAIQMFIGNSASDITSHDTYFAFNHTHIYLIATFSLLLIAVTYYLYPRITGRRLYRPFSMIHWIGTIVPVLIILLPNHHEGIVGAPRHYYDYAPWKSFKAFITLNPLISAAVVFCFLSQLLFVTNLIISLFQKRNDQISTS